MNITILLSGGLDSCVLVGHFSSLQNVKTLKAITFDYGSRHSKMEILSAKNICKYYNLEHSIIDVRNVFGKFSALTNDGDDIPEGYYTDDIMKSTIVPFRNLCLLSMVCTLSSPDNCISISVHSGDHAIYPDCRAEFFKNFNDTISIYGYNKKIFTPFISKSKKDIVLLGKKLNVPMEISYSCYNGRDKHCGKCGACVERKEAFALSEVEDSTIYES